MVLLPQECLDTPGLGSSAFARHYLRNHCCFLLLEVMRCFSSLRLPHNIWCLAFSQTGCPIRKSSDQGLFAPPRGLSQLITSFIASYSQGIHHPPFFASFISRSELFYASPHSLMLLVTLVKVFTELLIEFLLFFLVQYVNVHFVDFFSPRHSLSKLNSALELRKSSLKCPTHLCLHLGGE